MASSEQVTAPRVYLAINGASVVPVECSVHISLHQSADTFYAKIPLDNDAGLDETFWADTAPVPISILATNDVNSSAYTTLLVGNIDEPQIDFRERAVGIRGRDLTGALTDLKTSEKWQNRSNKDVITDIAGRVGISVTFNGDTDQAGLQYDQDYSEISDSDSCWNVIVSCAKRLGCIAFVKQQTLFVQPLDFAPQSFFEVNYQRPTPAQIASGDFVSLFCARNLNLAGDASLTVQSWQHKQGKTITSKHKSKGTGNGKLDYIFRGANMTKEQQDRIGKNLLKQTLSHERVITLNRLPGDVTLNPATMGLRLSGTGTGFDQDYIISTISHQFDAAATGYSMDIGAHNQDKKRGAPQQVQ
ncbi:hypothetical protein [Bradyrhizobium sp.]|uniref:hypothetical protein n=1 Tax=Bradyrhizobium sp. TaxID=376 RepID=UPI001EBF9D28|nr:hypothetical protein [Bradyrhizobium sp.]MBV9984498.1 hypothetical protein [Bradyrhizobium sp.]